MLARGGKRRCLRRFPPRRRMLDDAAAQTHIALIKHGGLSRRDGPLSVIEMKSEAAVVRMREAARRVLLPIPRLGAARRALFRRKARDPARIARDERRRQK